MGLQKEGSSLGTITSTLGTDSELEREFFEVHNILHFNAEADGQEKTEAASLSACLTACLCARTMPQPTLIRNIRIVASDKKM
jgi:hypothetical protein